MLSVPPSWLPASLGTELGHLLGIVLRVHAGGPNGVLPTNWQLLVRIQ